MTFHVGQKVVCVDNTLGKSVTLKPGERVPEIKTVYTIRELFEYEDTVQMRLVEIVNPICRPCGEGSFNVCRFRPVVERKTDISIFTAMLAPKKVTEDA